MNRLDNCDDTCTQDGLTKVWIPEEYTNIHPQVLRNIPPKTSWKQVWLLWRSSLRLWRSRSCRCTLSKCWPAPLWKTEKGDKVRVFRDGRLSPRKISLAFGSSLVKCPSRQLCSDNATRLYCCCPAAAWPKGWIPWYYTRNVAVTYIGKHIFTSCNSSRVCLTLHLITITNLNLERSALNAD